MLKKIGIVGCGGRLKSIIRLLEDSKSLNFIYYIYDLNYKAMTLFEEEFGERSTVICKTYNDILRNDEIEWVIIGSVNSSHKDNIVSALNAGKNIFSEKPLAISIEECSEIKKTYKKHSFPLKFLVSYPLRYSPHYLKIKEILDSNKIGKIISLEFNEVVSLSHGGLIMSDWRRFENISGGHLVEKCCHDIDLVNWLTKSIPVKVASFGGLNFFKEENNDIFKKIKESGVYGEKVSRYKINPFMSEKNIVDNQVAIIEYKNGSRATFHTNCSSAIPERRIYICGTLGTIRADLLTGKIEINLVINPKYLEVMTNDDIRGGHGGGDSILIQDFINVLSGKKIPSVSIDDAIKSAVSAIMIDKSRREGRVLDLSDTWKSLGYQ